MASAMNMMQLWHLHSQQCARILLKFDVSVKQQTTVGVSCLWASQHIERSTKMDVSLMNCTALCLIKSDVLKASLSAMGHALTEQNSIGVLLESVFSYKKNCIWMENHALLKAVTNQNVSIDKMAALNFDPKSRKDPHYSCVGLLLFSSCLNVLLPNTF